MSEPEQMLSLPLLPLKKSVLFPFVWMPLTVGRPASVATIEAVLAREDKELVVVAQRDASVETPGLQDFFSIGTKAGDVLPGMNAGASLSAVPSPIEGSGTAWVLLGSWALSPARPTPIPPRHECRGFSALLVMTGSTRWAALDMNASRSPVSTLSRR